MPQWTVDLSNATFDFAELAWDESKVNRYPEDDPQGRGGQFAPADYKKGTAYQGEGGSKKSDSSGGKKSGKSSGPARFKDSNGDGKDDRQLTPAELKKALSGLSADMRQALQIYPAVLGAIKMALENDEDPTKHLERLPLRLRGAAERAAKSVAKSVASGGSKSKSYKGMSARQISDLPDDERMAIPQSELPDPPSGYTWAEDRSLVPNSFYNAESSAWFVDLDELEGRDIKSLAPTDVLIRQMDWATFVERGGKTLKKFEQPGGESPDTNLDRAKDWALRLAKKVDGNPRVFLSVDESGQIDEEITRQSGD